ncbi:hypothetical protein BB561_002654 [Smittium simulii]|uniref:Plasma membrane iron permease n=1 Tax=Smittium simulii TaxID=133385 RepID=A0A2T9YPY0_9FUNG|nr:hypothetical protein BB561_002654 [Smittium simulii]
MAIFNIPIFFVFMRESIEIALIISVMLAFTKRLGLQNKALESKLKRQILIGSITAFIICLILGGVLIYLFYKLSNEFYTTHEDLWEGIFSLVTSLVLGIVGYYFLQLPLLTHKLENKIDRNFHEVAVKRSFFNDYSFLILSFVAVIREGLEAIMLMAGTVIDAKAKAIPLSVIAGIASGIVVGLLIYNFGHKVGLFIFLLASTSILYLMGSGMFASAIRFLESYTFGRKYSMDADAGYVFELGKSVWALDCCNPNDPNEGGYQIFQALLGWTNNATIGSILGYISYWLIVISIYLYKGYGIKNSIAIKSKSSNTYTPVTSSIE